MRAGIEIRVTPEDRHRLEVIVRDRNAAQKHVARAKVILATADGGGPMEVWPAQGSPNPPCGAGRSASCTRAWTVSFATRLVRPESPDCLTRRSGACWT